MSTFTKESAKRDAEVTTAIGHMPDNYLRCRAYGHAWEPHEVVQYRQSRAFNQTLQCVRCTSFRETLYSSDGVILSNHYGYSEGYLSKGVPLTRAPAREAIRVENFRRSPVKVIDEDILERV